MEDDQQQFDKDDYSGLDGQNGENFEQETTDQPTVEDGGDQAMETGGENEDDNEDERKIFVGGLSWETTTKDLREYFEKFGEVTSCTLKTDLETKQSRGFGFVVFKEEETVKKVLENKEHKLHGRNIDPKPANPREGIKKIFVGRLDPGVPEDDVKTYFGKFGTVAKVDFPFDKVKDQRRAFCFVEFESDKSVRKVLEQATHKLGGQEVDVKKATPSGAQAGTRVAAMEEETMAAMDRAATATMAAMETMAATATTTTAMVKEDGAAMTRAMATVVMATMVMVTAAGAMDRTKEVAMGRPRREEDTLEDTIHTIAEPSSLLPACVCCGVLSIH